VVMLTSTTSLAPLGGSWREVRGPNIPLLWSPPKPLSTQVQFSCAQHSIPETVVAQSTPLSGEHRSAHCTALTQGNKLSLQHSLLTALHMLEKRHQQRQLAWLGGNEKPRWPAAHKAGKVAR